MSSLKSRQENGSATATHTNSNPNRPFENLRIPNLPSDIAQIFARVSSEYWIGPPPREESSAGLGGERDSAWTGQPRGHEALTGPLTDCAQAALPQRLAPLLSVARDLLPLERTEPIAMKNRLKGSFENNVETRHERFASIAATPWLLVPVVFALGCGAEVGDESLSEIQQAATYGADNRIAVRDARFASNPKLRAVGFLTTSQGSCTGTLIAPNKVLTAAHCFAGRPAASSITFRPAFSGDPNSAADLSSHPSVGATGYFLGTGVDVPKYFGYVPGSDWAIVTLDPGTYSRGSAAFPATLAEYEPLPINYLDFPASEANITASVLGYSADFLAAMHAPHRNAGSLALDAVCSSDPGKRDEGPGAVLSNIERNPGASGGPIIKDILGANPAIYATVGGGADQNFASWTEATANQEVSSASFAFAPYDAAGIAFVNDASGNRWAFSSDQMFFAAPSFTVGQNATYQHHPKSNWQDFRDAGTSGATTIFKRMAATLTTDNHMWVFATDSAGKVWNKFTSSGTNWENWEPWFPTSASGKNVADLSVSASGDTVLRVFVLHNNCSVEARGKSSSWDGSWRSSIALGTAGANCKGIASTTVDAFQQVFVATGTGIVTRWEDPVDSFTPATWVDFGDGLPAGLTPVDVAAGHDGANRMFVAYLVRSGAQTRIYLRAKTSTVPGAAWGAWTLFKSSSNAGASDLAGATQIQMSPVTDQMSSSRQTIFIISATGGILTPAYDDSIAFSHLSPYYAPLEPGNCP